MSAIQTLVKLAFDASRYRRAAEAAGFQFSEPEVLESGLGGSVMLRGAFKCVCGEAESYKLQLDEIELTRGVCMDIADPAWHLNRFGSFGLKHLIADGYTREKAEGIVAKYQEALRG